MIGQGTHSSAMEMADVLLIRIWRYHRYVPPVQGDEQLGLLYLATYAVRCGYHVEVFDRQNITYHDILAKLDACKPRVVGFYCDHENMVPVCRISKFLKRDRPKIVIIVGGPQASSARTLVLERGDFDVLVRGEAEYTFMELLDYFIQGKRDLKDIQGISYLKDGEVIDTPDRPYIPNLDVLPIPDRSLNPSKKNPRGAEFILSGRGCPYHCAFCAEGTALSKTYRFRSPGSVLAEVDYLLHKRNARYILFMDDTFVANPSRIVAICKGLMQRLATGIDFRWYCEARVDILCKCPELLPLMKEAGLMRIQIGIESGNQHILDAYHKGITINQIRSAMKAIVEADIPSVVGNFIIGGAHENHESLENTTRLAMELFDMAPGRFDFSTTLLTPYPGTKISMHPEEYGLELLDPEGLTGEDDEYSFVKTEALNKWEILDARYRFIGACTRKMEDLLKRGLIPKGLIKTHIRLSHRYSMMTKWFELYSNYHHIRNFFGLLLQSDYARQDDIPPSELDDWYPVRTYYIGTSHEGKLVLKLHNQILEMDLIGTAIHQYCSGRVAFSRLVEIIRADFFSNSPRSFVKPLLLTFLRTLEEKYLIVWSRV